MFQCYLRHFSTFFIDFVFIFSNGVSMLKDLPNSWTKTLTQLLTLYGSALFSICCHCLLILINNHPAGLWTMPFCMAWTPNTTVTRSLPFLAMMRLQSQPLSTDVMKFSFQTEDTRQLGKGFRFNSQLYFPTICNWRYSFSLSCFLFENNHYL